MPIRIARKFQADVVAAVGALFDARFDTVEGAVFAPRFVGFGLDQSIVEYGSSAGRTLNWSTSYAPVGQTLNGAAINAAARSVPVAAPGGGFTGNLGLTLSLFDGAGAKTDERTATIIPRIPIFAGLTANASPTNGEIQAAAYKSLDSVAAARSFTLDLAVGGRLFIVLPAALPLAQIYLDALPTSGWTLSAPFDVTLATGATVSMRRIVLDPFPASPGTNLGVQLS